MASERSQLLSDGGSASPLPPVLIVDDYPANLVALESVLDSCHCRVVRAASGQQAVEKARTESFAAIVMDVRMPGLDGYAAASFIRQDPRSASTPILFITGHDDVDIGELTRLYGNTGQVDSLRKPFKPEVLRSKLRGWIELFRKDRQVHELERAIDTVQAQVQTKDDLLAMVAHDLKAPLVALRLSAIRLGRQSIEGDPAAYAAFVQTYVDRSLRTVDRMMTMLDNVLDDARIESGTLQLSIGVHRIDDVVAQSIELLQPLGEQKGVSLAAGRQSGVSTVSCDRDRIMQVLSNVIGNAIKFTPSGGDVAVDVETSGESVVVCVRDTGPGIRPEELASVFEKYWHGDQDSNPRGLGLGLAISREIVAAHGGRMWAESQLGAGSRFSFSLPRIGASG